MNRAIFIRPNMVDLHDVLLRPFSRSATHGFSPLRRFGDRVFATAESQTGPITDRTRLALLAQCRQESHIKYDAGRAQHCYYGFDEQGSLFWLGSQPRKRCRNHSSQTIGNHNP